MFAVTVSGAPKVGGKRNYAKADYCLFCKSQYLSKISKHFMAVHANEEKVKKIMDLPKGSVKRKQQLALLQNDGNHLHNCEVGTPSF